jgi:hypothetical protein
MEEGSRLIEGKYRGVTRVNFFDGIDISVIEVIFLLEIEKINNTPNTYSLLHIVDNGEEFKTLGNIIDGRLVSIVSSSVYTCYNLISDDKLLHNFCGVRNNGQKSGTTILERYY